MGIVINKLVAKMCPDLDSMALHVIERDNRFTGKTTGYLLSLLGMVISNPNMRFYVESEHPYQKDYRIKVWNFNKLQDIVEKLGLNFIKFRRCDLSVTYELYETFDNEYQIYNKGN